MKGRSLIVDFWLEAIALYWGDEGAIAVVDFGLERSLFPKDSI
jgi:hypothetical protein